jgi:hypothetical protein
MSPNTTPHAANVAPEAALALDCARIVFKAFASMNFPVSAVDVRVYGVDGRDLAFGSCEPVKVAGTQ